MSSNYSLYIEDTLLNRAMAYAQQKGINLSALIETLLANWTKEQGFEEKLNQFPISDKVKSLAGRMDVDGNSIDWDLRKDEYLKEKYAL